MNHLSPAAASSPPGAPAGPRPGLADAVMPLTVAGREVALAVTANSGSEDTQELVLVLHGLGCSRASVVPVLPEWAARRWMAVDLPGHGQTPAVPERGTAAGSGLGFFADTVAALIDQLDYPRVHLIGHSMGGAVAVLAATRISGVESVTVIEGNLVGEDCDLLSRSIAEQPRETWVREGHARLRDGLRASTDEAERVWGAWLGEADPDTVWSAAESLTTLCDLGTIAEHWMRLPHRTYLWGEDSGSPDHLEDQFAGVRVERIDGAGHFPMIDYPVGLTQALLEALDRTTGERR